MSPTMSPTIAKLAAALVAAQAEFPAIPRTAANPFFKSKYADLTTVVERAGPVLAKHGLAVTQLVGYDTDRSVLTTMLLHGASGEWIAATMSLFLEKPSAQAQGSAITYARRYAYSAILGLVTDDDDDGNATRQREEPPAAPGKPTGAQAKAAQVKRLYGELGVTGEACFETTEYILGLEPGSMRTHTDLKPAQLAAVVNELTRRVEEYGVAVT